jgi:hypothetical protein
MEWFTSKFLRPVTAAISAGRMSVSPGPGACPSRGILIGMLARAERNTHARSQREGPADLTGATIMMCWSLFVPMARIRNVFEIIELYGHDENFEPQCTDDFSPTHAPAGSKQKIDVLAERIQRGMPLWHPEDSTDSSADMLVGAGG